MPPTQSKAESPAKASPLRYALLIGVAALLVFQTFRSPDPVRPSGPLAEKMVEEIHSAAATAGITLSPAGCTMSGNINFGVTCEVLPFSVTEAAARLRSVGWQPSSLSPRSSPAEQAALVKDKVHLSLEARLGAEHSFLSAMRANPPTGSQ
jgi:hypothetical protein